MQSNRRTFFIRSATGVGLLAGLSLGNTAMAQTAVAENDAQAIALGYKIGATKVDKAKFPKYAAGQQCNNCALYQGKAAEDTGGCPLFAGKVVAGKGWCSAWAKKA